MELARTRPPERPVLSASRGVGRRAVLGGAGLLALAATAGCVGGLGSDGW